MDRMLKKAAGLGKKGWIVMAALFVFTLGADTALAERAPDFVLKNLQGEKFRLKDHRGEPVLLIFSTTWCPSCVAEIPRFKEIQARYQGRGLKIVNINVMETREKAARFQERHKLPYPTLLDSQGDVANIYRIQGVPTLVLLSRDGRVVCRPCVVIDGHLEKLLKKG